MPMYLFKKYCSPRYFSMWSGILLQNDIYTEDIYLLISQRICLYPFQAFDSAYYSTYKIANLIHYLYQNNDYLNISNCSLTYTPERIWLKLVQPV